MVVPRLLQWRWHCHHCCSLRTRWSWDMLHDTSDTKHAHTRTRRHTAKDSACVPWSTAASPARHHPCPLVCQSRHTCTHCMALHGSTPALARPQARHGSWTTTQTTHPHHAHTNRRVAARSGTGPMIGRTPVAPLVTAVCCMRSLPAVAYALPCVPTPGNSRKPTCRDGDDPRWHPGLPLPPLPL